MPKWGLTVEQRKSKPWGLSPELLEPAKTITDPVHSDIYLTNLEISFLDVSKTAFFDPSLTTFFDPPGDY
jgi:hypothetical protein